MNYSNKINSFKESSLPLRLYCPGTESCVFSDFCHATVTKCITAMKDMKVILFQGTTEPQQLLEK